MSISFNKILFFIFITLPSLVFAQQGDLTFNVATYNIRYDAKHDTANAWENRKIVISNLLLFNQVDILGIQEGLHHQVEELDSLLQDHSYVGVGRDDGVEAGEFSAIFYNHHKFSVLESGTFWLSETPSVPSKSWDAALPRICTWAVLKDSQSNALSFIFNTHFDHVGEVARLESAKLIHSKIEGIAKGNPAILMGDFNVEPGTEVYQMLDSSSFRDAMTISKTPHFGPNASFNNFDFSKTPERRIDFIFVNDYFSVLRHAILNNHYNQKYPSDHFPVIAEIKFTVD